MIDITAIEDALVSWVSAASGILTILSQPNAPRPNQQYALIHIANTVPYGVQEKRSTLLGDKSIDIDYSNMEELFVSINVYKGNDAYQVATKIKDSLGLVTVTEALYASGLGYLRATGVQDVHSEINKQWEKRGQFDVFFSVRSLDSENIESIQKVQITNNIDGYTTTIQKP